MFGHKKLTDPKKSDKEIDWPKWLVKEIDLPQKVGQKNWGHPKRPIKKLNEIKRWSKGVTQKLTGPKKSAQNRPNPKGLQKVNRPQQV